MATIVIAFTDAQDGGVDINPVGDIPAENQEELTDAQVLVGQIMNSLHAQHEAQQEDDESITDEPEAESGRFH